MNFLVEKKMKNKILLNELEMKRIARRLDD